MREKSKKRKTRKNPSRKARSRRAHRAERRGRAAIGRKTRPPAERRHTARASGFEAKVHCLVPPAQVQDISLRGVYLLLPDPPPVGEDLDLKLSLRSGESIDARGVVKRMELGRGAAVEFTELKPAAQELLAQFLSLQFAKKDTAH